MNSPKALIPLRLSLLFMSPDNNMPEHAPIAGEPAQEQDAVPAPQLSPVNRSTESRNSSRQRVIENGRYQGVLSRNQQSKKSKVLTVIQVLSIIVALILSSYALIILNDLQLSQGKDGQDAVETLVRSEGREAVVVQLLDTQADALALDINCQDNGFNFLALLEVAHGGFAGFVQTHLPGGGFQPGGQQGRGQPEAIQQIEGGRMKSGGA